MADDGDGTESRAPHTRVGGGRTAIARAWGRVPVVPRAIIVGLLVLIAGNGLPQGALVANLKISPAIPWSAPLICAYLWFYWQYVRGRWWPRSTAASRQQDLRARPLSPTLWRWSLAAGGLGIAALTALTYLLARLVPLGINFPDVLKSVPPLSLAAIVVAASVMAGIVEEAAFRGYMQGPIEKRHGPLLAILVVSIVFGLAHLTGFPVTAARMFLVIMASVVYGILAHLTGSILPGVVLHATGDVVSFGQLWWSTLYVTSGQGSPSASAWRDPQLWLNGFETIVLGAGAVWAFYRLADVARCEPRPLPQSPSVVTLTQR
jgi:membrane protease YdiL (CAAX protease family)